MNWLRKILLGLVCAITVSLSAQDKYSSVDPTSVERDGDGPHWATLMLQPDANFNEVRNAFYAQTPDNTYVHGQGWKQFHRWEYFWESRINPDGSFPNIKKTYNEVLEAQALRGGIGLGNWTAIGPFSYNNTNSWSPGLGRVNVIEQDPNDANTIYVGAPAGGVWKTTDNGSNWSPLGDDLSVIGISGIAVDPSNSNTVYLSTGDADGGDTYSIGVMKSTDGGATWNATGSITASSTNRITIDPVSTNTVWVAGNDGLYKSTDGGANWTNMLAINCTDMALNTSNSNTIYAVDANDFYYSTDGGSSWNTATGLPATSGRLAIGITAADANYVYVLSADDTYAYQGVYRSTNSGVSFSPRNTTTDIFDGSGQAWYDMAITVSQSDRNTVIAGCLNLWRSTNGGTGWSVLNSWSNPSSSAYTHADIHWLSYEGGRLYCGSDGGIYRSTNNGNSFTDLTDGIQIGQFYTIAGSPNDVNVISGGLQDNGGYIWDGTNWDVYYGADGMGSAVDPMNSNNIFGMIQYGDLYRTTNGGGNLFGEGAPGGETGNWVTPMVFDDSPGYDRIVAGYSELYEWFSGSWFQISTEGFPDNINEIAIAPSNGDIMYVATNDLIYRTSDGAGTFTDVTNNLAPYIGFPNISSIEINPTDPDHVWVSISQFSNGNKVWVTTDGGANWTNMTYGLPNLPCNVIKHESNGGPNAVYVGTDIGVYYYDDVLANWVEYNNQLPNVIVNDLEINEANNTIRAGTYGRGVWESGTYNVPQVADDAGIVNIINPNGGVCDDNFDPVVVLRNYGTNTLTSCEIHYNIDGIGTQIYNWTGTLAPLANENVTLSNMTSMGPHVFNAWTALPNGNADINNFNDPYSTNYTALGAGTTDIYIDVTVDCWGSETTWEIIDGSEVLYSGGPFMDGTGGTTYSDTACLADGCYDFVIYDGYGDGMYGSQWGSCTLDGDYTITDENTNVLANLIAPNADFGTQETNNFCVTNPLAALFGSDVTEVCAGQAVQFFDQSTGSPIAWDWTLPGGTVPDNTVQNPIVTYNTPGTYDVTLWVDNGGSTDQQTVTTYVTVHANPNLSASGTDALCFGDCNGIGTASATSGTPGYNYNWTGVGAGATQNTLCAGTYEVTVSDANGCVDTTSVTINEPTALGATASVTDANCGQSDGTATLTITGGISPYSENWGAANPAALAAGTYPVTVTDANNCTFNLNVTVNDVGSVSAIASGTDVSCNGGTDGTATVTPSGGTSPYIYDWAGEDPMNLAAGTYTVTVTDAVGCQTIANVTINEPSAVSGSTLVGNEIFGNDGSIDLTPSGGISPYTYDWDNDGTTDFDDPQDLSGLTTGTYIVVIMDANGCTDTISVFVDSQVGMDEIALEDQFSIIPNPASEYVTIKFNSIPLNADVIIEDAAGRLVYQAAGMNTTELYVDVNEWSKGLYFISVIRPNSKVTGKLMKN